MRKLLSIIVVILFIIVAFLVMLGIYKANFDNNNRIQTDNKSNQIEIQKSEKIVSQIINQNWKWVNNKMSNDEIIVPKKANAFSINFKADGGVSGKTDCNGFFGEYKISGNKLSFGSMGATLMFCDDSQESIFIKSLSEVESYSIDKNNNLVLELKMGSGSMIFK